MSTLKKIMLAVLLVGVFLPATLLWWISSSPQSALSLLNRFSAYQLSAKEFELDILTPRIVFSELAVSDLDGVELATIGAVDVSSQWSTLLFSDGGQWSGNIRNATVNIVSFLPHNNEAIPSSTSPNKGQSTMNIVDIHRLIGQIDIRFDNIILQLPDNKTVTIQQLERKPELAVREQGVQFTVDYLDDEKVLPIKGHLVSRMDKGVPHVTLSVPQVDLQNIMTSEGSRANKGTLNDPATLEDTAIDWSPLLALTPVVFTLKSDVLAIPQGRMVDLNSQVTLAFKGSEIPTISHQHSATLDITINDDFQLNGAVTLSNTWQPLSLLTQGADVKGETVISAEKYTLSLDGTMNLNHWLDNDVTFDIAMNELPVTGVSKASQSITFETVPWFPLSSRGQLSLDNRSLNLSELVIKAGQSDINGALNINFITLPSNIQNIEFDMASTLLTFPKRVDTQLVNQNSGNKKPSTMVFNDEIIDFSWVNNFSTEGKLSVDKILYGDQLLLEGLSSHIAIKDHTLIMDSQINQLAKGQLESQISLKYDDGQAMVSLNGSANELILESLALLPKDEFKGGLTNAKFSLTTQGNSTRLLASQLNGDILLTVSDGVIANNSFELLSSDLLLKLINSINPFYQSSQVTELECAVLKSRINNGILAFDNSIAMKTSKMLIVADGEVDLATETINLGINPKARSGVGLDIASLAKFVAIKGTLMEPKLGASASGSLKSIAGIGAAISTGGISLLASNLLDKVTSGDVCKTAQQAFSQ